MRVCIAPTYRGVDQADGGIRRVVEAQQRYLPEFGISVTDNPDEADLIACHGATLVERSGVPLVAHCHGLMWSEYKFDAWGDDINKHVVELLVRAQAVTAPSRWVSRAIARGMLVQPEVVYHGINTDEWEHDLEPYDYVLWNKARADQVSDPADMQQLAAMLPDVRFLSTFGSPAANVLIIGALPYEDMKPVIQRAGLYLATARETFGIGTLEALASGVPVVGWCYGGQEEIIREGETGYLAPYGDYEALADCVRRALSERDRLSANARKDARERWGWRDKIAEYARIYKQTYEEHTLNRLKVSVIITCHNLGRYLNSAVDSVEWQSMDGDQFECIIVDDQSTDDSYQTAIALRDYYADRGKYTDNIKVVQPAHNLGLSGARNFGFQHASGRYIIHLDADDMLAPNALDILSTALDQHRDIHIAYGHLDIVNHEGQNQQRNPWPGDEYHWNQQLAHLNQLPYAAMMRREVLERSGGYRVRDWRAEDAAFWARVTSFGFRAAKVTHETTLIYRLRSDSKSAEEARTHTDRDGDWTAWYPWRIGDGTAQGGMAAIEAKRQPSIWLVPFGAQGRPKAPVRFWPVSHHQEPAVSVIIPVGPGHTRYLVDALDSLVAQTCPSWEAIVVFDDLDVGEAGEITATCDAGAILGGHAHARVFATGKKGAGTGVARNIGLTHARAPLVLFLDADDILVPQALATMLHAYTQAGGRYIYSDWLHLEQSNRWDGPAVVHETPHFDAQAWLQGLQHPVSCLIATEDARRVGGFDETMTSWEDWDFYIKLAVAGVHGARVAQPLLIYRLDTGTRRTESEAQQDQLFTVIDQRYADYRSGDKPMASCCGGNAQAFHTARLALDAMFDDIGSAPVPALPPADPSVVRMEFTGDQMGAQTWLSKDRQRQYRAGREIGSRFINVDPRDVAYLESFGVFQVVPPPQPEPTPEPIAHIPTFDPGQTVQPTKTTRRRS